MRGFTLRFGDPAWEEKYKQSQHLASLPVMKVWALSALLVYWALGAIEWILLPDKLALAWFIRFGVCSPWYVISFVLAFHTKFRRHFPAMMLLSIAAASLSSAFMFAQAGAGYRNLYLYQYTFATLLLYLHGGIIFRITAATGCLLCTVFLGLGFQAGALNGSIDSGLRVLLVLLANIICMYNAYNRELVDRRYYRAVNLVAKQREFETKLQQQVALIKRQEAIGRLAGGVAHEFNNLLQVISGCAEYALEYPESRTRVSEQLRLIRKTALSGRDLTHQLLSVSRQREFAPDRIDLHATIEDQANLLRRLLPVTIELELSLRAQESSVLADTAMMEQVLLNLGANARDAMPKGGKLRLSTALQPSTVSFRQAHPWARDRTYIVLTVADTGAGMTPEIQQRIFEPFFTTKDMTKGTGLGLSTVYDVVQKHEGMVEVSSQPDVGTEFRLYIPLAPPLPVEAATAPLRPAVRGGAETLLVVEDNVDLCEVLAQLLELRGYRVLKAFDGREGWKVFLQHQADIRLAILDVMLPRMGGYDLFQRMRMVNPTLPVIFSSGYTGDAREPLPPGVERVPMLRKPYEKDALCSLVRSQLDATPKRRVTGQEGASVMR